MKFLDNIKTVLGKSSDAMSPCKTKSLEGYNAVKAKRSKQQNREYMFFGRLVILLPQTIETCGISPAIQLEFLDLLPQITLNDGIFRMRHSVIQHDQWSRGVITDNIFGLIHIDSNRKTASKDIDKIPEVIFGECLLDSHQVLALAASVSDCGLDILHIFSPLGLHFIRTVLILIVNYNVGGLMSNATRPADYDPRLRLQGTFKQNKFLLLYSMIFEIKEKYKNKIYSTEAERLAAEQQKKRDLNIFNVHNIYRELDYIDPETCKDELLRTKRFTIDALSQIDIR